MNRLSVISARTPASITVRGGASALTVAGPQSSSKSGLRPSSLSEHGSASAAAAPVSFEEECEFVLGAARMRGLDEELARLVENVSGLRRQVRGLVRPRTPLEVQVLVQAAGRHGIKLYPISGGRNWGFGSRLPVNDDCVLLDLSEMNRIREINLKLGYAVVEPGVSQGALARALKDADAPFYLDVTGAGTQSSVLGNALERGIAYNSLRCETLSNLEVVLGTGELIRTGFGHMEGAQTENLYPYGIGPQLDGLFLQSNMGIVTAATIRLIPKPKSHRSFLMEVDDKNLEDMIEGVAALMRSGVLQCVPHIANRERTHQSIGPLLQQELKAQGLDTEADFNRVFDKHFGSDWTAVGGLSGEPALVAAGAKVLKRQLRSVGKTRLLSDGFLKAARKVARFFRMRESSAVLDATAPFRGMTHGQPSDAALRCVQWASGASTDATDPDKGDGGLLFCVPLAPLTGAHARQLVELAEQTCERAGFKAAITLNALNSQILEAVVSIAFDRRDREATERAHECIRELTQAYVEAGLPPYRVSVNQMDQVVDREDAYWQTTASLKRVLDPHGTLSPGRYCLTDDPKTTVLLPTEERFCSPDVRA